MSILYKPELFSQPGVAGGGELRYRAGIVYRGSIYMDQIVKDIEKRTSVSSVDILAVDLAKLDCMEYYLSCGYRIILENQGTYIPFIQSLTCKNLCDVDASLIKRIKVGYKPCSSLEKVLSEVNFERARKKYW
jgi:hypothetical protein